MSDIIWTDEWTEKVEKVICRGRFAPKNESGERTFLPPSLSAGDLRENVGQDPLIMHRSQCEIMRENLNAYLSVKGATKD